MKLVIDIPDEQIEKCLEESKYIHEDEGEKGFVDITLLYTNKSLEFVDIVRKHDFYSLKENYKILPKGHGRLIDISKLDDDRIESDNPVIYLTINGEYIEAVSLDYLNSLQTIIEADKKYEAEVITRGKCMMCGKELTEGLFFCKECGDKANSRK